MPVYLRDLCLLIDVYADQEAQKLKLKLLIVIAYQYQICLVLDLAN